MNNFGIQIIIGAESGKSYKSYKSYKAGYKKEAETSRKTGVYGEAEIHG